MNNNSAELYTQAQQDRVENGYKASGGHETRPSCCAMQGKLWDAKIWCDCWRDKNGYYLLSSNPTHLLLAADLIKKEGEKVISSRLTK